MILDILEQEKDVTLLSNFKTPAKAKYYYEIVSEKSLEKLQDIFSFAQTNNLKILFVGGGTNMLFAFDYFEGIIIKNKLQGWEYDEETKIVTSYTNELIREIAESLERNFNQDLWHRFIGLPGSVGGAIFGNAGCFGLETENNLVSVRVYNFETGQIEEIEKADCDFSYRTSIFKKTQKYFIISVLFDLSKKIEKYHSDVDNIYFREHKQPKGNTCGSFFKNPDLDIQKFLEINPEYKEMGLSRISAGFLLEQAGFKGKKIGGAYFSELHSNFLMHDGQGTYENLLDLLQLAQKEVYNKFGVELINEVRIITN